MTMPTTVPISTVESGTKPNSLDPGPKNGTARANDRGRDRRPEQEGTRPAAPRGPPRAQDEHDAELGEQRHDEPRRLERGLAGTEEQQERGEGQRGRRRS